MTVATDPPAQTTPGPPRIPPLDTPAIKVAAVVILAMFLLIPIFLVDGVNHDRATYQEEARAEYQKSWGPSQSILGPILVVPYVTGSGDAQRYLHIAPHHLAINAQMTPEIRRRGLFRGIVYKATLAISGEFRLAREGLPVGGDARLLWEDARLMLGATDLREMPADATITWSGRKLALGDGPAGAGDTTCNRYVLLWAARPLGDTPPDAEPIAFSTTLDLRGTGPLGIVPIARQIDLKASAPWQTPRFLGMALPSHYQVDDTGFTADWTVSSNPSTGRWLWTSAKMPCCNNGAAATPSGREISVELIEGMPIYHMTERASKYAVLFLALAFLTYFLFEMIARVRIHIVEYGLLGLSVTLFGLLLISFSEPLGFTPAYAVSSLLVLGQASLFTLSVTGRRRLAMMFSAILAALFCFLYVVLSLEMYALLVGSVALFAALSAVMAVTRRIDWFAGPTPPPARREAGRGFLS